MAGAKRELNVLLKGHCRSRSVLGFSLLLLIARAAAWSGTDILVVGHTARLTVYNKYQQIATAQERSTIVPFVPMEILNPDDLLSDGFTRCMQVRIEGEVFYLLKDENGALVRSGPPGVQETFRNVAIVRDTIRVLAGNTIAFSPMGTTASRLPAGREVIRVFRHRNGKYYGQLRTSSSYGWLDLAVTTEGRHWEIARQTTQPPDTIPSSVSDRVRARLEEANRVFARLFRHFNGGSGRQEQVPQWSMTSSPRVITCTLRSAFPPGKFQQSTLYLQKDIENIALGAHLDVLPAPGSISLRLR